MAYLSKLFSQPTVKSIYHTTVRTGRKYRATYVGQFSPTTPEREVFAMRSILHVENIYPWCNAEHCKAYSTKLNFDNISLHYSFFHRQFSNSLDQADRNSILGRACPSYLSLYRRTLQICDCMRYDLLVKRKRVAVNIP